MKNRYATRLTVLVTVLSFAACSSTGPDSRWGAFELTLTPVDTTGAWGTETWMYEGFTVTIEFDSDAVHVLEGGDPAGEMYPEGLAYPHDGGWQAWLPRGEAPASDNLDFWLIHIRADVCVDARAVHRTPYTWTDWFGVQRESWSSTESELVCEAKRIA